MVAIAIFSADSALRRSLEQLLRANPTITVVGVADDPAAALPLIEQDQIDIILADSPSGEQLAIWRSQHDETAFIILVDGADAESSLDALYAGARAILPRSAGGDEIATAITAVTSGLVVLPRAFLPMLLDGAPLVDNLVDDNNEGHASLTPRELEVLAAMADGASNKAIARRLGISFHTAKFHVGAILAKLNAESQTEAVTRAAQLGLVML